MESDDPEELEAFKKRKYQYMAKDREGRDVFLADSNYVLQMAQMDFKHIKFHFTSEFLFVVGGVSKIPKGWTHLLLVFTK